MPKFTLGTKAMAQFMRIYYLMLGECNGEALATYEVKKVLKIDIFKYLMSRFHEKVGVFAA